MTFHWTMLENVIVLKFSPVRPVTVHFQSRRGFQSDNTQLALSKNKIVELSTNLNIFSNDDLAGWVVWFLFQPFIMLVCTILVERIGLIRAVKLIPSFLKHVFL